MESCFCNRKRSSSSWTRWTKSFSAEERKTPSKQRRARVTDGRACRVGGQDRDKKIGLKSAHSPRVGAARSSVTFESLAFVGSDGRRVSAGPRALTSEAGLGPPLPAPLCLALPGFSNSRALPTETPRDTQPPFPGAIRDPRREPPIPEALTHRGSPESGRCAESSAPPAPQRAQRHRAAGRRYRTHLPQRGVFLSCSEVGLGHRTNPKVTGLLPQRRD